MKVVITGGTGFVGRRLARALAARGELAGPGGSRQSIDEIVLFDAVAPEGPVPEAPDATVVKGDLADPASVAGAIDRPDIVVFHLGAMVSGGCEEDFDGAWQVNVEGTRNVLEAARAVGSAPRLVFTSTMGAFGGDYVREPVGDFTKQSPQTTYGVSKSIGELLVNDYARKGFVDARAARLATVIVRAGKPNMALSSYASAVIREPLAGIDYVCPVAAETSMPMIGYETCVGCLIRMAELDGDEIGPDRTVNVPGLSASVTEMLAALHRVAGDRSLGQVTIDADPLVAKVTSGWPRDTDNRRSAQLGLPKDRNVDEIIQTYIGDYVDG
ncbi:MAG: NAD-dependent epimerase/dehydratase family protein [Rhodospirillales bacterium]|nr:NAD-dependent epimerase/dehydratase family protein [Rhodospirillales bacterium]